MVLLYNISWYIHQAAATPTKQALASPVDTVLAAVKKELTQVSSPLREKQEQLMSHLLTGSNSSAKQLSTVAADLNR